MSSDREVAILGYGRFGRALGELCSEQGLSLWAYDPTASVAPAIRAPSLEEAAAHGRIVVLAVPVTEMRAVLSRIAPHVSRAELLLDVGSVKIGPIEAMRAALGASVPWIGTHPLFGPTSLALGERPLRVVVCPNPLHPGALSRARALFDRLGCQVIEQDADAHDRAMADTHALAFFLAKGLLDARAGEGVAFAPPSFQAIVRTIEAVRSDAGHLFRTIQLENPYAGAARRRLLDALANVDEEIAHGAPTERGDPLAIPDLGSDSPDLRETRDLIDELDRDLVDLFARRASLAVRAGRAKADRGKAVRDPERERALLEERGKWAAERGLDPDAVRDVFEAILRFSRSVQR